MSSVYGDDWDLGGGMTPEQEKEMELEGKEEYERAMRDWIDSCICEGMLQADIVDWVKNEALEPEIYKNAEKLVEEQYQNPSERVAEYLGISREEEESLGR